MPAVWRHMRQLAAEEPPVLVHGAQRLEAHAVAWNLLQLHDSARCSPDSYVVP